MYIFGFRQKETCTDTTSETFGETTKQETTSETTKQDKTNEDKTNEDTENKEKRKFKSIGEELLCQAFEEHLGRRVLVNIRPQYLKNPKTGRCLEYDCYDPISRTALEYNGIQHYNYPNPYHKTYEDFSSQLERDRLKESLSEKEKIKFHSIPYWIDCPKRSNTREDRLLKLKKHLSYIL